MFIPQRPYFPNGSLRDALAYPEPATAVQRRRSQAGTDEALLPRPDGRLDEQDAWSQKLSGGEQQRLAIARVLLKKPNGSLPTKPPAHSTKPPRRRCMKNCSRSSNRHARQHHLDCPPAQCGGVSRQAMDF
jgi:energy-coupling factor transporter ATP-binding protein EcfA2